MNIESLNGVGPVLKKQLEKININTVNDLLEYYPYKYTIINIVDLNSTDDIKNIKATIIEIPRVMYIKKTLNKMTFRALSNGTLINVTIFNRAFLKNNIIKDKSVLLTGKYDKLKNSFVASDINFNISDDTILPIYHLTEGLKNSTLSKTINTALISSTPNEYIPEYLNEKYDFMNKIESVKNIHKPSDLNLTSKAMIKLKYEELFIFMFKINYLKSLKTKENGISRNIDNIDDFISSLPFSLTKDQISATNDILKDMNSTYRMNRLLLGDVGSGKTIVSVLALYINYLSGHEGCLMAPTEILATQHYNNIKELLKDTDIKVVLLTGKNTKREKEIIYKQIENHEVDLVIGTHALFNERINYNNLGLVITDEQHRFGVKARMSLQNKGVTPDVLYLSATPIPRTYALTIYGDLDISMIKTKPNGRKDIVTKLVKEKEIKSVLYAILEEFKKGHQVYVVSPLIEDNDELDLKSVNILKDQFSKAFPGISIDILHGKLKNDEKNKIMDDFKNGKTKILISTTVIEVGIDVKNATMMIIYNAERFGLATLHQLRGRVGRGSDESFCFLISNYDSERLHVLEESNDGFYISEKDFELRGAGDMFGVKQSGDMVFKIANLQKDYDLLLKAKDDSEEFLKTNEYLKYDYYKKLIDDIKFID